MTAEMNEHMIRRRENETESKRYREEGQIERDGNMYTYQAKDCTTSLVE